MSYVRTGDREVDFLARGPGSGIALIQVAAELDEASTREREVKALLDARKEYPKATLELVTLTPETARGVPETVAVRPAWQWFLTDTAVEPWMTSLTASINTRSRRWNGRMPARTMW